MAQWSSIIGGLLDVELGSEDSTQLYTTARRISAGLEGEREFVRLTKCLQRESSITCSNGVGEYDLLTASTDFYEMAGQGPEYALVSSNSTAVGSTTHIAGRDFPRTDIERLNRDDPGWRTSTGSVTPTSWYLRADGGKMYLGVVPPPTIQSSEAGSLRVPYLARPTQSTLSSGSTSEPFTFGGSSVRVDLRPYHQAIVHWAAHKMFKLRRDTVSSQEQLQAFLGYVTSYLQAQRPKGGQRVSLGKEYFRDARRRRDDAREGKVFAS